MIRFSRIFFYVTVTVLLIWQLPWYYVFLALKLVKAPFTMYSSVLGDFVITQLDENKQLYYYGTKGNTYIQQQVDSLLPSLYVRRLTADECFPDTICGRAVSPKDIQLTSFTFKSVPSTINTPQTELCFLMGSMSKQVDLKMPEDAFRLTNKGMESIRMEASRIDEAKSKLFTNMLAQRGFAFPANCASDNPTTREDHDEGYLVPDANHKLFHLKCTEGRPHVRTIQLFKGVLPGYVFITKFRNRRTLGYMVDNKYHFYVIDSDGSLVKLVLPGFNPAKDELIIFGNMFDQTVRLSTDGDDYHYALDITDYSLIKKHVYKNMHRFVSGLSFISPDDRSIMPHL